MNRCCWSCKHGIKRERFVDCTLFNFSVDSALAKNEQVCKGFEVESRVRQQK